MMDFGAEPNENVHDSLCDTSIQHMKTARAVFILNFLLHLREYHATLKQEKLYCYPVLADKTGEVPANYNCL
jgi:hypothetical protein